jgi:hypothetical protein
MEEKPTPEVEAKGLKAYEQARAFERMRTWRLPVTYAAAPVLPTLLGLALWGRGYPALFAAALCFSVFLVVRVLMEWRRLKQQYADNLTLLSRLETKYGDALPWVQVENHFAALEELKREIAAGKGQAGR